jgi:hypothetical protein
MLLTGFDRYTQFLLPAAALGAAIAAALQLRIFGTRAVSVFLVDVVPKQTSQTTAPFVPVPVAQGIFTAVRLYVTTYPPASSHSWQE